MIYIYERVIHDDEPCTDGYIMKPDYPECGKIDRICAEHPDLDV